MPSLGRLRVFVFATTRGTFGEDQTWELHSPPLAPLPFFPWCDFLLTESHRPSPVGTLLHPFLNPSSSLLLLLLLTGQCPNPGPATIYTCPVCLKRVSHRHVSFLCHTCGGWVHKSGCSGLARIRDYSPAWDCPACVARHSSSGHDSLKATIH